MADTLKITFLGGSLEGQELTKDLTSVLLVGRSHTADIRLTEADVSGKHFQFLRSDKGVFVRDMSRHGLMIDGQSCAQDVQLPVRVGSEISIGQKVRLRVDVLPEIAVQPGEQDGASFGGADVTATDFFASDEATGTLSGADRTQSKTSSAVPAPESDAGPVTTEPGADTETHGDFAESLTEAGEGETQEMKTRVGSMEEIIDRKRQLDRASVARRWKFAAIVFSLMAILGCIWFALGLQYHTKDAEGPYLPNGKDLDVLSRYFVNGAGGVDVRIDYPRDDRMIVKFMNNSNSVDVSTFLGVERDVPFHVVFERYCDYSELVYSLEDSFERFMRSEKERGVSFEFKGGGDRPEGMFFEQRYPGWCEIKTQHGTRFIEADYTRSRDGEIWHGVLVYFRRGDVVYRLRREIPSLYWRRAGYRLHRDLGLCLYEAFLSGHWESPGKMYCVSDMMDDNTLLAQVRHGLSVDRAAELHDVGVYLNTLLMRSWGKKPMTKKEAFSLYRQYLAKLTRFYNERQLAFETAKTNRNEKRMRNIMQDCLVVFGDAVGDRRSLMIKNPEVWACLQDL